MSQNTPGSEFDKGFLDSDVDLEITSPPENAEIYASSNGFQWPSPRRVVSFLLWICLAVGGAYYFGYQTGLEEGRRSLPPVLLADKAPLKVPAEALPEADDADNSDLNIYGVMRGDDQSLDVTPENFKEGPADNAPGTIESLIEQTADFEATSPASPQAPNVVEAVNKTVKQPTEAVTAPVARPDDSQVAAVTASAPATAPAASARQDYMVQLSATRSRALARGAYRTMQEKHDDLLGRRDPLIIRTDLGDKGIYYRVNVPGFATLKDANGFCGTLKKRGQDCLVRKQPQS
jgi:hypothetical protein